MKKILILLMFLNILLFANIAKVVAIKGKATILRDIKTIPLELGSKLLKSDIIDTLKDSKVQIIFKDNTIITIGKSSHFEISEYVFDEENKNYKAKFGLLKGTFRTITGKIGKLAPQKFKLHSKTSSIGIRGTQILSNIQVGHDTIFCTEGKITVTSILTGQKIEIKAGEFIEVKEGEISPVQKFDVKTITTTDTNTRFLPSEEQEETLDNFGIEIEDTSANKDSTSLSDTKKETKKLEENIQVDNIVNELEENIQVDNIVDNLESNINDSNTDDTIVETVEEEIIRIEREAM